MKLSKILTLVASAAVLSAGLITAPTPVEANAAVDVYTTPGNHTVNGRQWRTTCENYSKTVVRCRAEINATQVFEVNGKYVSKKGFVFNNLTYKPSTREGWKGNPLGFTNSWTDKDKRRWKTECDNATTGGNGCRTYIFSNVIQSNGNGGFVKKNQWVFNNIVMFTPGSSGANSAGGSSVSTKNRLAVPLKTYRFSSQFGPRIHPITKKHTFHTGLDMAASCGSTITSSGPGVVSKAGWNNAYGNRAVIKHDNGLLTTYSHMSSVNVKNGQRVSTGSIIGKVGTSGLSTGCHLHFEVVRKNLYINPYSWLTGLPNPTNATHPYSNPSISPLSSDETQLMRTSVSPMSAKNYESDADVSALDYENDIELADNEILVDEDGNEVSFDNPSIDTVEKE